jgi:hypothetical protein
LSFEIELCPGIKMLIFSFSRRGEGKIPFFQEDKDPKKDPKSHKKAKINEKYPV